MEYQVLSTWNQIAPRVYIRQCYCFPYQNDDGLECLETHLTLALTQLAKSSPAVAGRIFLVSRPVGHLSIRLDGWTHIPLKVSDERNSFSWTYAQLKLEGFPAKAFVSRYFDLQHQLLEDHHGIPIFEVHARVIEGGLLLFLYFHHSISDGTGMDQYITSFADLTRHPNQKIEVQNPDSIHIDLPKQGYGSILSNSDGNTFVELLNHCPEYCVLSSPTGPTQFRTLPTGVPVEDIKKTGRIFVIGVDPINKLKEKLVRAQDTNHKGRVPSTFVCLAALTWAHVTKARLLGLMDDLTDTSLERTRFPKKVRLMISIDWRRRAFASIMNSSTGNAIALPTTEIETAVLLAACSSDQDIACTALEAVVHAIEAAIRSVDDNFVARRTTLFRSISDPRLVGLNASVVDPFDFYFNTWRHFGTRTRWRMPGIDCEDNPEGIAPDAIRRAQSDWSMGSGLILPERNDSVKANVLVTLGADDMAALCTEPNWEKWVDDILE